MFFMYAVQHSSMNKYIVLQNNSLWNDGSLLFCKIVLIFLYIHEHGLLYTYKHFTSSSFNFVSAIPAYEQTIDRTM